MWFSWRFSFLCVLVIGAYLPLPTKTEAGFIVAKPDPISVNPLLDTDSVSSSGKPSETPAPHWNRGEYKGFLPTGMSTPSSVTSVSGGSAIAGLPPSPIDIPTLLTARLGPEGRVWLPPPFSTGIFRPPRFVV